MKVQIDEMWALAAVQKVAPVAFFPARQAEVYATVHSKQTRIGGFVC